MASITDTDAYVKRALAEFDLLTAEQRAKIIAVQRKAYVLGELRLYWLHLDERDIQKIYADAMVRIEMEKAERESESDS
jgi:hypothetical protein